MILSLAYSHRHPNNALVSEKKNEKCFSFIHFCFKMLFLINELNFHDANFFLQKIVYFSIAERISFLFVGIFLCYKRSNSGYYSNFGKFTTNFFFIFRLKPFHSTLVSMQSKRKAADLKRTTTISQLPTLNATHI